MTILLSVILSVLLLSLVVLTVLFVRLYGKLSACEKENNLLQATNQSLNEKIAKKDDEMVAIMALREEQFARIAALESENRVLEERLEAQKEQFNATMEQMRKEFKDMAGEALERNSEILSRQSQEKLSNILTPFNNDLKQFREKVENIYALSKSNILTAYREKLREMTQE